MNMPKIKHFLEKNAVLIFSISAAICTTVSVITAINATPKAYSIIKDKGEELSPTQMTKQTVKAYAPTIIFGVASIGCVAGAFIFSEKQRKCLTNAWIGAVQLYTQYRQGVIDLYGKDADKNIIRWIQSEKQEPNNDGSEQLYWIEGLTEDGYLTTTPQDMLLAQYELNRLLTTKGYAKLNDFANLLGLPETDIFDGVGWSLALGGEMNGKFWVDFFEEIETMDDGLEVVHVTFDPAPYNDYIDDVFPPSDFNPF